MRTQTTGAPEVDALLAALTEMLARNVEHLAGHHPAVLRAMLRRPQAVVAAMQDGWSSQLGKFHKDGRVQRRVRGNRKLQPPARWGEGENGWRRPA